MYNLSTAVKYHYNQFPPQAVDYGRLINELLAATEALARYDQMLKTLHNSEILLAPLRNQEAVISSRMEGTISTIDEILELEAQIGQDRMVADDEKDLRSEVMETLLYQRALKTAQKNLESGYSISHIIVRQMHQQLLSMGRGAQKQPGIYKTEQNYLGDKGNRDIKFIPISPEQLESGLDNLFAYLGTKAHPELLKTAFMHLEFEALHPFQDGNGRIGRMLITLYLWQAGLISSPHFYISGFLEDHKETYIAAMRAVSKEGNWEEWARFFLVAVKEQADWNCQIADNIRGLYEEMKLKMTELLSSKWTMQLTDFLFTYPKFRGPNLSIHTGIPKNTATPFIKRLLEEKIIVQQSAASGRKPALYSFEPLLRLVRV